MPAVPSRVIAELLWAWQEGDEGARDRLVPLVYEELRHLAHRYLRRERPGHALQTTDLVHETYLRLVGQDKVRWENRSHFFGVAAGLMRRILVDHARSLQRRKRGRGWHRVAFDEAAVVSREKATEILAVDEALRRLESLDARKSRVVELRFFGGLTVEETAQALGTSTATVARDWEAARGWLYHELGRG
jgi:RNA polymerase sigma factor (TIGR02999 family)